MKLFDLEEDHKKASANIRDKIDKIKSSLSDLRAEYAKGLGSLDASVGEEVVRQEEKIAEIRKKLNTGLRDVSDFAERKALVEQLKKEEGALKEFSKNSEQYEEEIAEARRRSRLTDFERFLEDAEKKREILTEDFNKKQETLQAELDSQNAAFEEERAIYEAKRTELEEVQATHEEMVNAVETGNNSMVANTRVTADALEKSYNKIKASLDKIRSITAPKGVADTRSDSDVFAQTNAPSPINSSNPFQPTSSNRGGASAANQSGGMTINIKGNYIDSEERKNSLLDAVKASLGRDLRVTSLGG
jgi:DNA repair exonuclease SbcCD ATPase subunit